jgi:diguanylate cyclase (GGDEF)-like protein
MCGKERVVTETERQKGDGQLLPVRIFAYPLQEAGSFHGAYVIYEDIAGRVRKEAKILNMAKRDPLTGIFNRRAFLESTEGKNRASLIKEQSLAFFFLDLNEFKEVNDNYGHYFGDRLLVQIARGLQGLIRDGDVLGRIGGDEFALVVSNCNRNVARNISERLVGFFRQTFHVQGMDLSVGVSIGVAICPGDGSDVPSLMRFADEAMYRAKRKGCGFCFYS